MLVRAAVTGGPVGRWHRKVDEPRHQLFFGPLHSSLERHVSSDTAAFCFLEPEARVAKLRTDRFELRIRKGRFRPDTFGDPRKPGDFCLEL